jgi:tetratricopeptide (TPR) repeat protein
MDGGDEGTRPPEESLDRALRMVYGAEGTICGPYVLVQEVGSGAMGRVYLAHPRKEVAGIKTGTPVALKVVHPFLMEREGFFKRFLREAEIGRFVRHENVVRVLDCDAARRGGETVHFVVMEYVEGQTLRGLLKELSTVPEELCRHVGREVAKGLSAIHAAGAVHRDLKPENVVITKENVVKVMDLGLARLTEEALALSSTGAFVGTVLYAAPEQLTGEPEDLDGRADLYSLGLVLYELATGTHPFPSARVWPAARKAIEGEPRRAGEVNPQLTAFFEEVVHTLLEKDREDRFFSAAKVLEVLTEGEGSKWWEERAKEVRARTRRPLRRVCIPRETAVYGREADLEALREAYGAARSGEGRVVLLEGEAGIGKTRLTDEFVGRLRAEGEDVNFLLGSYAPGGASAASGAFLTAYREQFGAEGLEETLKDFLTVTPGLIPAFAALLRGEPASEGKEPLTKDAIHTVFVHATQALSLERPTIVLIEDLHFAPEEGRALFTAVSLAAPGHRILLLGTMRPGVPEGFTAGLTRYPHVMKRTLSRLSEEDLSRLLAEALRSPQLSRELLPRIFRNSDGNPWFAFEILRSLRGSGSIARRADGTWKVREQIGDLDVPSSVADLIGSWIADISEPERELLDVAGCCGFTFEAELVAEAAGQAVVPALRHLAHLETDHRLVRSAGDRFEFDHHQVQETLYGRLSPPLAKRYHGAIAEALEKRGPPAGAVAVEICDHFLRAGRGENALPLLDAVLSRLRKTFQIDRAIDLLQRALALPGLLAGPPRVKTLIELADILDHAGRRDRQRLAVEEAIALSDAIGDPPLRVRSRFCMAQLLADAGRPLDVHALCRETLDLALLAGDRKLEGHATANMGLSASLLGRISEAFAWLERGVGIRRELGDRRGEMQDQHHLGYGHLSVGRYAEAQPEFEQSLAIARELGDRRAEALACQGLGTMFEHLGRYPEARAQQERALAIFREVGYRMGQAGATGNLGNVAFYTGRFAEARRHFADSLAISREIGSPAEVASQTGNLGNAASALGLYAEAREFYAQELTINRDIRNVRGEPNALHHLGCIEYDLGRYGEARAYFEKSLALARSMGSRRGEWFALIYEAYVAMGEGSDAEAERLLDEAFAVEQAVGDCAFAGWRHAALGRLRMQQGRTEEARDALSQALAIARERSEAEVAVRASAALATLPGGDLAEALRLFAEHGERVAVRIRVEARFLHFRATGDRAHLAEAKQLLDFLIEHAPPDCRESMLANVRLHREIAAAAKEAGLYPSRHRAL